MAYSRRKFLKESGAAGITLVGGLAGGIAGGDPAWAQTSAAPGTSRVDTPVLTMAYEDRGNRQGFPVFLLHGFPDDVRAWDEVAPPLVNAGYRVLAPYFRGYGPTRFRDAAAPRMAEQAAIGQDVIDFADALHLERFAVVGYDWGGRAAAIAAALHPDRVRAVVLIGGYTIQDTIAPSKPADPATEQSLWYQWYFNTERGRAGLAANRRSLCRFLWETWSPGWHFTDETFARTAASFDNPDFVDLVIHSYRHRHRNAPGEQRFMAIEQQLAQRPKIRVPSVVLRGEKDAIGRTPAEVQMEPTVLTALVSSSVVAGAGHFMPREKPDAVSSATLELLKATR